MGKIPWKSIGSKYHGKHGVLTMLFHASMGKTIAWKAWIAWVVKLWNSMDFMEKHRENSMEIHWSKIPWKAWGIYHAFHASMEKSSRGKSLEKAFSK